MPTSTATDATIEHRHHFRFHAPHRHLASAFGDDWFGVKAEAFARFFGTPVFLVAQTLIVTVWIILNVLGVTHFDIYPFILLNLAFSLQAAYAAPLILLAQTRQADRDKAHADADAQHREALALAAQERSYKTLERLCSAIADRMIDRYGAEAVTVRASKPEPPIPLPVEEVSVEVWKEGS